MPWKTAQVDRRFDSPGPHPNGLQAAPDGLWCIDQGNGCVYRQDYETGEVLFEAQTDTLHSSGITLGGDHLWIASTYALKISKLDASTGETVAEHDSPGSGIVSWREAAEGAEATGAHGLEWSDGRVYVASPPSQMIHVMDAESWEEVHHFRCPGLRVHGIAWGPEGRLWVADTSAGTVSLVDPGEGRIYEVIRVLEPVEVHGLTIHQGVLWYCDANTCEIGRLLV
ncbi:hypothetical protein ACFL6X_02355 [Candidatus Latescibacterota bacterium]